MEELRVFGVLDFALDGSYLLGRGMVDSLMSVTSYNYDTLSVLSTH